jgi:hypothetical protein
MFFIGMEISIATSAFHQLLGDMIFVGIDLDHVDARVELPQVDP